MAVGAGGHTAGFLAASGLAPGAVVSVAATGGGGVLVAGGAGDLLEAHGLHGRGQDHGGAVGRGQGGQQNGGEEGDEAQGGANGLVAEQGLLLEVPGQVLHVHDGVDAVEAAAFGLTHLTAWRMLVSQAGLAFENVFLQRKLQSLKAGDETG